MEFSSADVPISRETWTPRSPPRDGPTDSRSPRREDRYEERQQRSRYDSRSPPPAPRESRDRDDGRDERPRAPPSNYDRPSGYGNGYSGGGGGGGGGGGYRDFAPPPRPRHAPAQVEPTNVLGVFGLSIRTRERDLEDEFNRCGEVEKVVIVYDQRSDRSRGFGFITMRTVEDAQRCIDKLNGISLQGRAIRVDFSATQKPHNPTPGQYMGERRPDMDERYPPRGGGYGGGYDRRDDRRSGYDRYDDRDRGDRGYRRDDDYRRRDDDRYERKRSSSPGGYRRSRQSPSYEDRRPPPPSREYDDAVPAGDAPEPRY